MSDKLKVIKVNVFITDDYRIPPELNPMFRNHRYVEIFVPIAAISFLTEKEFGNPEKGYDANISKDYLKSFPFPIKSINGVHLTKEQVEVVAGSK